MNREVISVIVAIYNAEKYVKRSINSILNQTYKNLEIILIDDGSTDDSGKICDQFASKDSRIVVIHKENEGLSAARNTAITIATGRYISFIDSDDELREDAFELAVKVMEDNHFDFIKYEYCVDKAKLCSSEILQVKEEVVSDVVKKILKDEYGSQLWQYLFKRELWEDIVSPVGRLAQDMMTLHRAANRAKRFGSINQKLYYYFQTRQDNVSNGNKGNVRGTVDRAFAYWLRYEFCYSEPLYLEQRDFCLKKAIEYTISCFSREDFWTENRYKWDFVFLKKQIKTYREEIIKCKEIPLLKKICVILIEHRPNLLIKIRNIVSLFRKEGGHEKSN